MHAAQDAGQILINADTDIGAVLAASRAFTFPEYLSAAGSER